MNAEPLRPGDLVRYRFQGEDAQGNIIDWPHFRARITDAWEEDGEQYLNLQWYQPPARVLGWFRCPARQFECVAPFGRPSP